MKHTVLVTGSSRGIGRAIAERFARDGHRVALLCRERRAEADALRVALQREHLSVMAVQGDVSEEAEVARMLEEIRAYFGPVDVLVNNAGIALPQQLLTDCTAADWDRLFAVNVRGAFLCCRGVLPDMVRKKRGSIVNLSSMWGVTGGSCEVPYSASKAALIGLTKALAREVAPSGIRVNCVAPGFVPTGMNAHLGPEAVEGIREETPLLTLGTPEDVAAAVCFLACEDARFLTGQVLCCDGGRCM